MDLDRRRFPALARTQEGCPVVYLDGPGGSQMVDLAIDAQAVCARSGMANRHAASSTSRETDELVDVARLGMARFLGAAPSGVVFGANMTTLAFALARTLARGWAPGGEVVVTELDHRANVDPWRAAAEDRGLALRWVPVDPASCTLDLAALEAAIGPRTVLVAVGLASNVVGTVTDVAAIAEAAHRVGARVAVDAVHAAPHIPVDAGELGADLLFCSSYKFFGPHLGIAALAPALAGELEPYKVAPAPDGAPECFETGTQSFEALAGLLGALAFLGELGGEAPGALGWLGSTGPGGLGRYRPEGSGELDRDGPEGSGALDRNGPEGSGERGGSGCPDGSGALGGQSFAGWSVPSEAALRRALARTETEEGVLAERLRGGLAEIPGLELVGPPAGVRRTPTVAFRLGYRSPRQVATALAEEGIFVGDGDFYASSLIRRLGFDADGGVVRMGLAPYNTAAEVDRTLDAVRRIAAGSPRDLAARVGAPGGGRATSEPGGAR